MVVKHPESNPCTKHSSARGHATKPGRPSTTKESQESPHRNTVMIPPTRLANLHLPVLGHFGALDQNPSRQDAAKLTALMTDLERDELLDFHEYPNAKHGFSCQDSSSYLEEAAQVSWGRTMVFLGLHLDAEEVARSCDAKGVL